MQQSPDAAMGYRADEAAKIVAQANAEAPRRAAEAQHGGT